MNSIIHTSLALYSLDKIHHSYRKSNVEIGTNAYFL